MRLMCLAVVLVIPTTSHAAPAPVIAIDVDADKIESIELLTPELPWNDQEPGGMIVPPFANKSWFTAGLRAGDILRYEDGHAVTSNPSLSEGVSILDIVRDGKPLTLRIVVHGETHRVVKVNDGDVHGLSHRVTAAKQSLATPLRRGATPSGVRIIDNYAFSDMTAGDIIRSVDGKPVTDQPTLVAALENLRVGATTVELERDGRKLEFVYEREPAAELAKIAKLDPTTYMIPRDLARTIAHDTDMLQANITVTKDKSTITLTTVDPTSLLAKLGFETGDTIVDIAGNAIDPNADLDMAALHVLVGAHKSKTVVVHVKRKTKTIALSYEIR